MVQERPCRIFRPACGSGKGHDDPDVLKSAFSFLFEMEEQMNEICDKMGEASENEMNQMMEELGTIQDLLMAP